MSDFFLWTSVILGFLVLLCLYRGIWGPGFLNRIVAINVIGTKVVIMLVLMGFVVGRIDMLVDISLGYALLNFITTVVAAKYLDRRGAL